MIAIIPARYKSVRLEGKLLLPIAGKPLVLHTLERVSAAGSIDQIIVAVDDERIFNTVQDAGFEAVMTSPDHESGTDRVAEVAGKLEGDFIIVNVQADEPLIDPETVDRAIISLQSSPNAEMATCSEVFEDYSEVLDPNVVKVVTDSNGFALYFSRSVVPYPRDAVSEFGSLAAAFGNTTGLLESYRKHTGIYVYRKEFLMRFADAPPTEMERLEKLEQLRALEMGGKIQVVDAAAKSVGVDTLADYKRVKDFVEQKAV